MMLTELLKKLQSQQTLSQREASNMLHVILAPLTPIEQIAGCLVLLNLQQNNIELLVGVAEAMRQHMQKITVNKPVLDIVGTGGDDSNTINISTASALLMASCGIPIAKNGNRAVSSACGSADVLEALGVNINLSSADLSRSIENDHFGFCFAPNFHPALLQLRIIRKQLGIPTIFNLMGPLLNPAHAEYLMIGVYKPELCSIFARMLAKLPIKRGLVFHSAGLDELSCVAPAEALLIENRRITSLTLDARAYGLSSCTLEDLRGGNAQDNAQLLIRAFNNSAPHISDTLIFNAGVGAFLYGACTSIAQGIELARQHLVSGTVLKLLGKLRGVRHA